MAGDDIRRKGHDDWMEKGMTKKRSRSSPSRKTNTIIFREKLILCLYISSFVFSKCDLPFSFRSRYKIGFISLHTVHTVQR
jgi:hypothetical protein